MNYLEKLPFLKLSDWLNREGAKFVFHPLIHTLLGFAQAQDVEKKKAESRTPHFLTFSQDIVARSPEEKCVLK